MKSVLISIQPKWCELIASGKKTIEVRKTKPKLDTPFKVYIYQTQGKYEDLRDCRTFKFWDIRQKVIGEFVCDGIIPISIKYSNPNSRIALKEFPYTCLTDKQIIDYLGNGKQGYGWHISDLVIYDKPKELSGFSLYIKDNCPANLNGVCLDCKRSDVILCENLDCPHKRITRPPQSWLYVESEVSE